MPSNPEDPHKKNIIGMSYQDLRNYCSERGYQPFRATQLFNWIYLKHCDDFSRMSNLPLALRQELKKDFRLEFFIPAKKLCSSNNDTVKYCFWAGDGHVIESVVLWDNKGRVSFCISSQLGCAVKCIYCATGKQGLIRNLNGGEIVNQVISLTRLHGSSDSILYMGMGEPLLNYQEFTRSILLLREMGTGWKKITVSTCGIIDNIYRLANSGMRPRLAVSMGSPIQEKRNRLIPGMKNQGLDRLKKAILFYREKTRRRVSLEYTYMKGVNDTLDEAAALAAYARATRSHINLISFNPVPGMDKAAPEREKMEQFKKIIKQQGVEVSERYSRGSEIAAGCGQLKPEIK